MDPEKKKDIERSNAKLGRGCVYVGLIGMVVAYIPFVFIDWHPWIEVLCALVAGPIVAFIIYIPLGMAKGVGGFFLKSFSPRTDDDSGESGK